MEKEWFSWTSSDGDIEIRHFYDVILKKQIGPHLAGSSFKAVSIYYKMGVMELVGPHDYLAGVFKINITIKCEIPKDEWYGR